VSHAPPKPVPTTEMDVIAEGIIPSMWLAYKIPFTQILLLLLTGGLMSLAYNLKKDIFYLTEAISTVKTELKGTDTIAHLCDDDIVNLKADVSFIKPQLAENDSINKNLSTAVLLLEVLNKQCNRQKKKIESMMKKQEEFEYDTTVNQQWYGILKAQTQYGNLEIHIAITNTEVYPKIRNNLWLEQVERATYMDNVVRDVISITSPMTDSTRSIQKDLLGFSGSVKVSIAWNNSGRYYELEQYLKKYKVVWEKRLVPLG